MIYTVESDYGDVHVQITDGRLCRVWSPGHNLPESIKPADDWSAVKSAHAWVTELMADLRDYLAGQPVGLERWQDRFNLDQATPFRRRVYDALLKIGRGQTCTYGQLAQRVGSPAAARAIGSAMAANPLPLFVPCHRVLSTTGLGGYGGGLQLKQRLLVMEGALEAPIISGSASDG